MKRILGTVIIGFVLALGFPSAALAQSGHFVQTQTCTDIGTQVRCTGKVAGLGGTEFEIKVIADGIALVECTNHGGNVAPGQTFETTASGSSGPLATPRNGQFRYRLTSIAPAAPADSCPNDGWTAEVVDVQFTTATIQLYEDGALSDEVTVPVN